MKKFLIGAFGAVGVIFILAASIGMWILIGALLVWLASLNHCLNKVQLGSCSFCWNCTCNDQRYLWRCSKNQNKA